MGARSITYEAMKVVGCNENTLECVWEEDVFDSFAEVRKFFGKHGAGVVLATGDNIKKPGPSVVKYSDDEESWYATVKTGER